MAKKFKFLFDSPVAGFFSIICAAVFLVDFFVSSELVASFFTCPGKEKFLTLAAFDFKSPLDYVKIFSHVFGSRQIEILFINLAFVLCLGSSGEEKYGSVILVLMIAVSALVSGVLTSCLSPYALTGCGSVVFLFVFLNSITSFMKKNIPFSAVLIFVLYFSISLFESFKLTNEWKCIVSVFIDMAGGLSASLFAFLVASKKRSPSSAKTIVQEDTVVSSKNQSSSDETVIGNLKF